MLDYQVKYWANQEAKRSNLANEAIRQEANRLQGQANAIAQQQADVAKRRAETDQYNATVNAYNAATTRYKAQQDVLIGKQNALSNTMNAQTNWQNALTNIDKQVSYNQSVQQDASVKSSQAALNSAKVKESEANAQYTTYKSWYVDDEGAKDRAQASLAAEQSRKAKKETSYYGWKAVSEIIGNYANTFNSVAKGIQSIVPGGD